MVSAIKLVAEIALLALAGQGLLAALAGAKRSQNLFYQVLQVLTRPFIAGTRFITPRVIIDRHVPLAAFLLLLFVWIAATIGKINLCFETGVNLCR